MGAQAGDRRTAGEEPGKVEQGDGLPGVGTEAGSPENRAARTRTQEWGSGKWMRTEVGGQAGVRWSQVQQWLVSQAGSLEGYGRPG